MFIFLISNGELKDKIKFYIYFISQEVLYLLGLNGKDSITLGKVIAKKSNLRNLQLAHFLTCVYREGRPTIYRDETLTIAQQQSPVPGLRVKRRLKTPVTKRQMVIIF
jgi:hypothetical protein